MEIRIYPFNHPDSMKKKKDLLVKAVAILIVLLFVGTALAVAISSVVS